MANEGNINSSFNNFSRPLPISQNYDFSVFLSIYEIVPITLIRVVAIIFFTCGTLTNLMLITYLWMSGRARSPTFTLIACLASTDFCICLVSLSWMVFMVPTMEIPNTGFTCNATWFLAYAAFFCNVMHMVLFAGMRFWQLVFPLKARAHLTSSAVLKCSLFIWLANLSASVPAAVYFRPREVAFNGDLVFVCDFFGNGQMKDILDISFTFFPSLLILLIHIAKNYVISRSSRFTDKAMVKNEHRLENSTVPHSAKRTQPEGKAIWIVLILFFLTWYPDAVHRFVHFALDLPVQPYHDLVYVLTIFLVFMNSFFNPWVYALVSKEIRKDILSYFIGGKK